MSCKTNIKWKLRLARMLNSYFAVLLVLNNSVTFSRELVGHEEFLNRTIMALDFAII